MQRYVTVIVILICVATSPGWGAEWERIAEEEARIVFYAPGLSGSAFHKREQPNLNAEVGIWRGPGGAPRAEIYLSRLAPGMVYRHEMNLEKITRNWNFLKGKDLKFAGRQRDRNVIGSVEYRRFTAGGLNCLAFHQGWGPQSGADNDRWVPPNNLSGYYCDRGPLSDATVKAIIGGIGWRGYRVPAKPPAS